MYSLILSMRRRQEERRRKNSMGQLLIFVGLVLIFSLIGMGVWWIYNKVSIGIRRQNSVFEIEKETHEKIKEQIKEEND